MVKSAKSRRELKTELQTWVSNAYEDIKEHQQFEEDQTYLKSYLIESNREDFSSEVLEGQKYSTHLNETEDEGFLHLRVKAPESVNFYFDKLDNRFWVIHTTGKAEITDDVIEDLVFPRFTKLDFPWIPNQMLQEVGLQPNATFRKFSLKFEDEFGGLNGTNNQPVFPDVGGLSMQLWGENAWSVLSTLRESPEIRESTPLTTVGIRKEIEDETVIDDITYTSKFTARGDSVDGHFQQVYDLKKKYEELLKKIENDFSIRYPERGSGFGIEGKSMMIAFEREVEHLEQFLNKLFNSANPFRMWGVLNELQDGYFQISAVDLHTGDKLNLEACPEWLRIYLPAETCGNVVLRLYTNIQHYYDSEARLEDESRGEII